MSGKINQASQLKPTHKYRGQTAGGLHRVSRDGVTQFVRGTSFSVRTVVDEEGGVRYIRSKRAISPGYIRGENDTVSILSRSDDRTIIRVLGNVENSSVVKVSMKIAPARCSAQEKDLTKIREFDEELAYAVAQRDKGLDPDVRLSFVCRYVGESIPTIYRKIKLDQFPAPVKRGRSSFWTLSSIDAYRSKFNPK